MPALIFFEGKTNAWDIAVLLYRLNIEEEEITRVCLVPQFEAQNPDAGGTLTDKNRLKGETQEALNFGTLCPKQEAP